MALNSHAAHFLFCLHVAVIAAVSPIAKAAQTSQRPVTGGGAPAVSPDGSRIAFNSDRDGASDLYVISVDGTGEVRLTRTPEGEGRPRWTSDGERVVFSVSTGDTAQLFTIGADGTGPKRIGVVCGRNPIPLPDGKHLLYSTGDWTTMQLAVAGLDGSRAHQISNGRGAIWNTALAPDGKHVAYTLSDTAHTLQVWEMNVDGSDARALTHFAAPDGRPQVPAWSKDGRRIAIQANGVDPQDPSKHVSHIWVIDVATGAATKLAPHAEPYLDEMPAWFPDGKRIAFQSSRTGRMEIWTMNADGTGQRQLTGVKPPAAVAMTTAGGEPQPSPDGSRILFASDRSGQPQLHLMNGDGSDVRQLTNEVAGAHSAKWSPDGKQVAFVLGDTDGLAIINADGTNRRVISEIKGDQSPSWSPDGSMLAFAAGTFPNINIHTMNTAGGDRHSVSPNPGFDYDPAWSPDGKTIAFVQAARGQGPRVWLMNADGSNRRRLTATVDAEERPAWSPDGRHVAFQAAKRGGPRDVYVHVFDIERGVDQRLGMHDRPWLDETPSWLPDGKHLVFQSDRSGRMEVWVMRVDGTEPRQIMK